MSCQKHISQKRKSARPRTASSSAQNQRPVRIRSSAADRKAASASGSRYNCMLPRSKRLTRREFATLPHKAILVHGECFSVKVSAREGVSKFAVIISAKMAKRSVDRHLIKRRAMEAIQKLLAKDGIACVFYAKASATKATFEQISTEIKHLLQQATQEKK